MSAKFSKIITVFENTKPGWLLALFIVIHLTLLMTIGIQTGLEADKYIGEGTNLYQGRSLSEGKYWFYAPVILLVWLCKTLHISVEWIILVQIVISAFSQYCFYRMLESLVGRGIAMVSSILLLICIPYQIWNLHLYSDSLFISFCLLLTYQVFRSSEKRSYKAIFVALPVMVLVMFSRPSGILLIIPFCVYFIAIANTTTTRIINSLITISLIGMGYLAANFVFRQSSDMSVLVPYIEEHIICFVPTRSANDSLQVAQTGNAVHDLWYYITHNPGHFVKMILLRLKSIFSLHRPYYSTLHNIYLITFTAFLYLTAIAGIAQLFRWKSATKIFLLLLLFFYPVLIALQCDDWHSRFIMIIFPYLCMLSALGLAQLSRKNWI